MLWWAAGCFVSAAATALLSPLLLTVGRWQLLHPRSALTAWFGAFALGIVLVTGGLVVSVLGAVAAPGSVTSIEALLLTAAAWFGLGALGAVAAFVTVSAEPLVAHQREVVATFAPIARSREELPGFTLVRFDSIEAFAYAVPGRYPEVFISSAMETLLTKAQLRAVLAHEYAHLRHHHGWAVRIAQVNALCLSRLRPGQALKRATLLLVELAADDAAARQAGAANLANALTSLATHTGDASMHLRAERLTNRRWPRSSRRRLPKAIQVTTLP